MARTWSADGSHRYSVFRTSDGKRAVVVINQEASRTITARVDYRTPESWWWRLRNNRTKNR